MNTINCLVIDDEKQARNALRDLIVNDFPYVHIIAEADVKAAALDPTDRKEIRLIDGSGR